MNKKIKFFFSLSILTNVLLIGTLIGGISKAHMDRGHKQTRMKQQLSIFIEVLPEPKRKEFEKRMASLLSTKEIERAERLAIRNSIIQVFESDIYDKKSYLQHIQKLNQLHQSQIQRRADLISDIAVHLSTEERRQLSNLIIKHRYQKHR